MINLVITWDFNKYITRQVKSFVRHGQERNPKDQYMHQ